MVKSLPVNARDSGEWVEENPLEKEMATHSSSCPENPMDRGARGGLQSMESRRAEHDWASSTHRLHAVQPWQSYRPSL